MPHEQKEAYSSHSRSHFEVHCERYTFLNLFQPLIFLSRKNSSLAVWKIMERDVVTSERGFPEADQFPINHPAGCANNPENRDCHTVKREGDISFYLRK